MLILKKELKNHYIAFLIYFLVITLVKRWFTSPWYLMFWLGGIIGTILPDIDHFVYALISRPHELTSKRVKNLLDQKEYLNAYDLLLKTRLEHRMPILHTVLFQIIFVTVSFFVISSSGSLFGRGVVVSILLHFLVDQFSDFFAQGNINNWFVNLKINLDRKNSSYFLFTYTVIVLVVGLIL